MPENYLFRNKIAQPATPCNLKQLEQRRDSIAKREAERISNAEATKAVLDEKLVKVDAKIGEEGQLFGSVTSQQIVEAIKAQLGVDVDRKRIVRGATIKTAGRHAVEINLYRDINAKVVVLVGDEPVAEEPAAEELPSPRPLRLRTRPLRPPRPPSNPRSFRPNLPPTGDFNNSRRSGAGVTRLGWQALYHKFAPHARVACGANARKMHFMGPITWGNAQVPDN